MVFGDLLLQIRPPAIGRDFPNHHEEEDARRALRDLCQGNRNIEEFNINFNARLSCVQITNTSQYECCDEPVNHRIVQLGRLQGGWLNVRQDLAAKQAMVVASATDVTGMGMMDCLNHCQHPNHPPCVEHQIITPTNNPP
ncbi:hypothetical protein PSHT_08792 [Puccinia striiformis]|uniref:Retrotransposon gag domain-containing protein n=1 Tax=Puccinia striiformis TaxID=27350 RepID=A0A2S4VLP6_9BASI|nr:hypothetical protein PSHT_08792 [Puccinia striiformis]